MLDNNDMLETMVQEGRLSQKTKCGAEELRDREEAVDSIFGNESAMLHVCRSFESNRCDVIELDDVTQVPDQSMYEPSRKVMSSAHPKRFHRTVWRSIGMRLIRAQVKPCWSKLS